LKTALILTCGEKTRLIEAQIFEAPFRLVSSFRAFESTTPGTEKLWD